ncbi:hypothetical protein LCGC14_0972540 [marine sediment metagenome]|uniref:Uncharacterized protein n=1 Tax=marine sediment metagenome TaxID=412755 RepID=A0A0F9NFP6_9ZZZZ
MKCRFSIFGFKAFEKGDFVMNLEEIVAAVAEFSQSAETCLLTDDPVGAYNAINSLHDLLLDHFVDLPKPG